MLSDAEELHKIANETHPFSANGEQGFGSRFQAHEAPLIDRADRIRAIADCIRVVANRLAARDQKLREAECKFRRFAKMYDAEGSQGLAQTFRESADTLAEMRGKETRK